MKFSKLYIRNFRSIQSHLYTFDHSGLCGIIGSNGVGKSSLLLALVYNLFGRISKDVKLSEVVNWDSKGDLLTQLEFTNNGSSYTIIRTVDSTEYGTDLIIIKDGQRIRGANKTETQTILEEQILGMNFDTFCSSVYFNIQSAAGSILYATEANRRKAFNEITGLDYYDKFFAKVKDKCKELKETLQSAKIRLDEVSRSVESDGTVALAAKVKTWQDEHEAKISELTIKDSKYSLEVNQKVLEMDKKMDQLRAAIQDLENLLSKEDNASKDAAIVSAEISILSEEISDYYKKMPELEVLNSKTGELITSLNAYKNRLANLDSEVNSNCDECGQLITREGLDHIRSYLNNKTTVIKQAGAPLYERATEIKKELDAMGSIEDKESKLKELKAKLNSHKASNKAPMLKASIEANKNSLSNLVQRKAEVKATPSPYKAELDVLSNQTNPYTELLEKQREQYIKLLERKQAATTILVDIQTDLAYWERLKDYEKELKLYLVQDTVTSINYYLASFLDTLGDGVIKCEFIINEGSNITIDIAVRGNATSFFSLSLGQQAIARFCTQLAFFKHIQESLGLNFPFLFLDEGLDGMDETNKAKAADLIRNVFNNLECVYIIDHDKPFLSKLDTYIEVEADNGITKFL
jgi:DNA repair exonuclease SbcCD ATPase subunit